jgi:hypothetical protein
MFDNAQTASADIGQIRNMTQMGYAEAVFRCRIEHAGPFDGMNDGPIYANINVLLHPDATSLS